jgi:hypothetical protein
LVALEMNVFGLSAFWNPSSQTVVLHRIIIRVDLSDDFSLDLQWGVYREVAPYMVLPLDLMELTVEQWHGTYQKLYGTRPYNYVTRVLTPNEMKDVRSADMTMFILTFLHEQGPEYQQIQERAEQEKHVEINTIPCYAEARYVREGDGKELKLEIPCIGVVRWRNAPRVGSFRNSFASRTPGRIKTAAGRGAGAGPCGCACGRARRSGATWERPCRG